MEKGTATPGTTTAPRRAAPHAFSLLPENVGRRLEEDASLRLRLALRASAPHQIPGGQSPPGEAERRRAAAAVVKKAAALIDSGRFPEAIPLVRQAAVAEPENSHPHYVLGATLVKCGRHAEAVAALERAIALRPNFAPAHHMLGATLQALGRDQPAIAAFRRAVQFAPRMVDAHLQLGKLLQGAGSLAESQESFRRAAAVGRNTTAGRICEALVLAGERRFAEAANRLRQALAVDPTNYEATAVLAQMLATLGEIEPAIAMYERALTLSDHPLAVWMGLLQIKKMTEADRPLVAAIRAYIQQDDVVPVNRMRLHFSLGKAFNDLRDYEAAMRHYDAANAIRRGLQPFDRNRVARQTEILIPQYTAEFFAEHEADGVDDETPVLVLGMPRSGTTLVEQVLSSHPRITGGGELYFWVEAANKVRAEQDSAGAAAMSGAMDAATARRLAGEYLVLLRGLSANAARVTDKMPFNFHVLGHIRQALPRARFIHCRRHPIDTCLSIFFTDFDKMRGFVADREALVFYYRNYLRIMEHWRAVLPPDRFIEVDYEAMIAEPEAQARRLIDFCGLEWDPACLHPEENKRTVQTASVWQVRQPIYRSSLERWRCYEPWLGSLRELMPQP